MQTIVLSSIFCTNHYGLCDCWLAVSSHEYRIQEHTIHTFVTKANIPKQAGDHANSLFYSFNWWCQPYFVYFILRWMAPNSTSRCFVRGHHSAPEARCEQQLLSFSVNSGDSDHHFYRGADVEVYAGHLPRGTGRHQDSHGMSA